MRKGSFFKNIFIFSRKQIIKKSEEELSEKSPFNQLSGSSYAESIGGLCPSYSYEAIVSGQAPLNQLDLERIEVRI